MAKRTIKPKTSVKRQSKPKRSAPKKPAKPAVSKAVRSRSAKPAVKKKQSAVKSKKAGKPALKAKVRAKTPKAKAPAKSAKAPAKTAKTSAKASKSSSGKSAANSSRNVPMKLKAKAAPKKAAVHKVAARAVGGKKTKGDSNGAAAVPEQPKPTPVSVLLAERARLSAKPKPPPPRKVKRVTFDKKTLKTIKDQLVAHRTDLEDQVRELEEESLLGTQMEMAEVGSDEEYADAGTATFERERDLSIANNIQDLIAKINKALSKIGDGSYGLCQSCGEPISAERLKALPHVLLCIRCKKEEERR